MLVPSRLHVNAVAQHDGNSISPVPPHALMGIVYIVWPFFLLRDPLLSSSTFFLLRYSRFPGSPGIRLAKVSIEPGRTRIGDTPPIAFWVVLDE